jgi:hypothetical protein
VNYKCTNNFSPYQHNSGVNNIPVCDGDYFQDTFGAPYPATRTVLEMEVKFWNCWPTGDPDYSNWTKWVPNGPTRGGFFYSNCTGRGGQGTLEPYDNKEVYPNFSYFINYVVEPGTDTSQWFLASDVDISTLDDEIPSLVAGGAGSTHHADSWWGWHTAINGEWIDNCVNFKNPSADSGCGFGYLSDAGDDNQNPLPGRALVRRENYPGPWTVSASQIFTDLCVPLGAEHAYQTERHAAWCKPNS